jgi:two-component system response regulator HydG
LLQNVHCPIQPIAGMKKILVIDDDTYMCNLLVNYLNQHGYQTEGAFNGANAKKIIEKNEFDLILCDYRLPDSDGLKILQHVKTKKPLIPVVIMTAYSDVRMAVKLIKSGAYDYVAKPIHNEEILQLVNRALTASRKKETSTSFQEGFITGKSKRIKEVLHHVQLVAPSDITVLIEGETGSGKEYIARAIHYTSKRKDKPFIPVDCGAIPKELANSELFGHIKGAFTGAINDKKGYFEQAKGGTIFLDEVGNLPHENQVKLLRALQERIISRVGDSKSLKVDVRLIAASNEDLIELVNTNEFREDLYHRLNGFKIRIPALRDRGKDVLVFADFFITQANRSFHKQVTGIDQSAQELLLAYQWYGNIRELQNVINRAVLLSTGNEIKAEHLPDEIRYSHLQTLHRQERSDLSRNGITELKEATLITEKEVIANALIKSNFNKSKAAKMLNIDRKTLYNKIKLYKIDTDS